MLEHLVIVFMMLLEELLIFKYILGHGAGIEVNTAICGGSICCDNVDPSSFG